MPVDSFATTGFASVITRQQPRGEMAIAVAQLQGFDAAGAVSHGVVEIMRAAGRESRLSVLLPHGVQRLESRF